MRHLARQRRQRHNEPDGIMGQEATEWWAVVWSGNLTFTASNWRAGGRSGGRLQDSYVHRIVKIT